MPSFILFAVVTAAFDQSSYTVTECADPRLDFSVVVNGQSAPGRPCVVSIATIPGTAMGM